MTTRRAPRSELGEHSSRPTAREAGASRPVPVAGELFERACRARVRGAGLTGRKAKVLLCALAGFADADLLPHVDDLAARLRVSTDVVRFLLADLDDQGLIRWAFEPEDEGYVDAALRAGRWGR